jgi:hypothetical protein
VEGTGLNLTRGSTTSAILFHDVNSFSSVTAPEPVQLATSTPNYIPTEISRRPSRARFLLLHETNINTVIMNLISSLNFLVSFIYLIYLTAISYNSDITYIVGSQRPRVLRHEMSSLARTLESWVRIPFKAWMSVCVYSVFVFFCV